MRRQVAKCIFLLQGVCEIMTLLELLEDRRRCANRLWDPDMAERYLALTKELNKMAEFSTLIVDEIEEPVSAETVLDKLVG